MDPNDPEWLASQMKAMEGIAPILDNLETEINRYGSVDMLQAYIVALGALRVVDMEKSTLEQFVAVLMADRTHHAVVPG